MMATTETVATEATHKGSAREVLRVFFRLAISSFGGPIAHISDIFAKSSWYGANGSMNTPMPISSDCANSCLGRPAARSDFPSG